MALTQPADEAPASFCQYIIHNQTQLAACILCANFTSVALHHE
jgi:hypothetical protein